MKKNMKYNELEKEHKEINDAILILEKKIHMLHFILLKISLNNTEIGKEEICKYDITELWREYSFKLEKSIYYIYEYINGIRKAIMKLLEISNFDEQDTIFIPTMNSFDIVPAIYSFDSMIVSISSLIEGDWKNIFSKYLNPNRILSIFPDNKDISLFWELNIIRNRIVHPTLSRYNTKNNECRQFVYFSTFPNNLSINNGELSMKCRIPDMYSSEEVKYAIRKTIELNESCSNAKKTNVFDILFPETSATGKNRKNPTLIVYDDKINYDHIYSSIRLINDTLEFIDNIINLFFEEQIKKINNDEIIKDTYVVVIHNVEYKLKIDDIFNYYFKE